MSKAQNPPQSAHWARIEEAGFAFGISLMYQIYRFLGKWPFRAILYPVMVYFYLRRGSARTASHEYLQRVRAFGADVSASRWGVLQHFMAFGECLLDKVLSHTGRYTLANVAVTGREKIQEHLTHGQGVVLFTAHIGNLEVSRAIAQYRSVPITILVHTANSVKFNQIMKKMNPSNHVNFIQVADFGAAQAIVLANKIAAGEVVVIAADRVPLSDDAHRMVSASFLGHRANFPTGAYVLAHLLQSPVFTVFCALVNGRYELCYQPFSDKLTLPRRDRESAMAAYAQQFSSLLEEQCVRAPLQWFNFFDFWRKN
ncbi:MAG: acyltransferase [Formosimonas sp.]